MSVQLIIYYLNEEHSCDCGCDHNHENDHIIEVEDKLISEIKTLGSWGNFMPSSYLVKTEMSSDEILEKLSPILGKRDLLFVSKIDGNNSACLTPNVIDWIKS